MHVGRELFAAGVLPYGAQDLVMACGGYNNNSQRSDGAYDLTNDGSGSLADCEIYDVAKDEWMTNVAALPVPRDNHAGVSLADGRFVVVGGRVLLNDGRTDSCLAYTHTNRGPLPDDPAKLVEIQEVIAGTRPVSGMSLTVEEIEVIMTHGRWDSFPSLNTKRSNHAICLVQGGFVHRECIVATGGWDAEHTAELYDPQEGRWFNLPCRTRHPRKFHAMASIDTHGDRSLAELFRSLSRDADFIE
uniref:Uncharacterized protein n=2 Tax=Octactis speculum TaxID=3111310 RepID=A0A7S2H9S9_9STRA|mmetsp:Transcript_62586/g.86015  ORF Transcript_62586/g.86015 Transcript_62586/m.86015 type:complete len:245 (+) Transcript_62586:628-1362(+)